jgi:uncharacterized membrane protein (UPF0136 family)
MRTIEILAGLAIIANAVIYGTDVFGAIVQRPALAAVDDRTLTQVMGHIHRVADRRLAAFTVSGLLLAIATTIAAGTTRHWTSTTAAAVAALAVVTFVAIYARVSKPVNVALTAAAIAGRTPDDARALQTRWDSVINGRVVLQTIALAALCIALAAA